MSSGCGGDKCARSFLDRGSFFFYSWLAAQSGLRSCQPHFDQILQEPEFYPTHSIINLLDRIKSRITCFLGWSFFFFVEFQPHCWGKKNVS